MQPDLGQPTRVEDPRHRRRLELLVFFVLAIVVWPVVAVGVVGGWGFAVWSVPAGLRTARSAT